MGDVPITKCPTMPCQGYIPSEYWSRENGEESLSEIFDRLDVWVKTINGGFKK